MNRKELFLVLLLSLCCLSCSDKKHKGWADNALGIAGKQLTAQLKAVSDWNYDSQRFMVIPRDASVAAIATSAFLELSDYVEDGKGYYYWEALTRYKTRKLS